MGKLNKKLHKWPGFVIAFILIFFSVSGIIMNHRHLFSSIDISRDKLPEEFHYKNWNNGALKGNLIISKDSILMYGNIGVWCTDSVYQGYSSLNKGLPAGSDNRRIFDLHRANDGNLYAATQFGLYAFDNDKKSWEQFNLNSDIDRFVAVESVGDTLYALNRSFLFKGKSNGVNTIFRKIELQKPAGFQNKVSLFTTIWQVHSGEIFGITGKLFVDALGVVTIILSITGIIFFLFPKLLKAGRKRKKNIKPLAKINRWSLFWHNRVGAGLFVFLVILFFTGMFLRPPLLISIANSKVSPLKYSHLDQENAWYDKLRGLKYDKYRDGFVLATSEGILFMDKNNLMPQWFYTQPPVSVMGINVLEEYKHGTFIVGSFSGLFLWNPDDSRIYNYATGKLHRGNSGGKPIGDFKVTGLIKGFSGEDFMVDYDRGVMALYHEETFGEMPEVILKESNMSLWNLSLEIHTGRFFRFLFNDFYILIVPLSGLISIIVTISGYIIWRRKFSRKK